jgi:PD-(D/E)XK nuclease superfamily protein
MQPQLKSFDENGCQYGWDQTSIKLAEECLYKYKLKMLDGWRPRNSSVHLFFGGVYASCLEHFHKFRAEGVDHETALTNVVREALVSTWIYEVDSKLQPIPGSGAAWQSDHNTKTRENLIRTIVWYFEQFKDDSCQTVILSDGVAAVEHSFQLPVDDGIIFAGHLDRLVNYSDNIYIQDQKTTATTITSYYFKQYELDTQMSMYSFAGKAIFHLPIKGVMIDAAQIAVGFTRFERGFSFQDEARLNEWYDDTMYHIGKAVAATKENHFPRNRSSCNKYGGCEFREVCSKSPHVREQFLKAEFEKQKRWDPLEAR